MPLPKSKTRLVVVVSDIHAGSSVGLCPPDFETLEGQRVGLSKSQRWLWECWQDVGQRLARFVGNDPFALVVNGDTIEGVHHHTKEIVSADPADHQRIAEALLEPLAAQAGKTFVVEGTECHTGTSEAAMAKRLGAERDPDTGKGVWERLSLTVAGTRCIFQHHITPTSREYLKGSALSIHLGNEIQAAASNGEPIPRVLCSAHRHDYDEYRNHGTLCVVGPSWQLKTRHGRKVVPSARTRVGLYVLDWRRRNDGELPDVEPILCQSASAKGAAA